MSEETTAVAPITTIVNDQLLALAEGAEKRVAAINRIMTLSLKVTNPNDWKDIGGKPYLEASGAQKIARLFGISWHINEPIVEYEDDGHFTWTYVGEFMLGTSSIQAIGTRSSKDTFFSRAHDADIPPSEIDKGDVKKSAYTNCLGRGVKALLGLNNMTWDQIRAAGLDTSQSGKVSFKQGTADPNAVPTLPNYGKYKGQPIDDPAIPIKDLQYYLDGAEKSLNDPSKEKYRANNAKMRDALKAEIAKRDATSKGVPPASEVPPSEEAASSIDDSAWADMTIMWSESNPSLLTKCCTEFQVPNTAALKPMFRTDFARRMRELCKGGK